MSLSVGASNTVQAEGLSETTTLPTKVEVRSAYTIPFPDPTLWDFTDIIVISDDSDGSDHDSSKTHGLTSVADNESILQFVEVSQEVDQEDITSDPVMASQLVESPLPSPPRDTEEDDISPPVPMKYTVAGKNGGVSSPKKPYRSLRMNAINSFVVKKKRAKKSARKRKKSAK